jgi:cellulose synthase/poly-beta-1,6-N-acetylglucosamine synthase-like glycosyltransferase
MPDLFLILAALVIFFYCSMIIAFTAGWKIHHGEILPDQTETPSVSILVPCRNEEDNILPLASALESLDYPRNKLEVIWIDDHSTDQTSDLIAKISPAGSIHRLVSFSGPEGGKKAALQAGMGSAKGEYILLTDADSRPGAGWVKSMIGFMQTTRADLAAGPVMLSPSNRWHEQVQKLEFMSLVASSAGAAGLNFPFMIQGPNICVRAEDYRQSVKELDNRFLSGDDVFLLQSMKSRKKNIRFNLDRRAIVESKTASTLHSFLRQRQRWASKAKGYTDTAMVAVTLTVFIANLTVLASALLALAGLTSWLLPVALFAAKSTADLILLIRAAAFFKSGNLLFWFLPVQILYPLYIVGTAIWAMAGQVRWKQS